MYTLSFPQDNLIEVVYWEEEKNKKPLKTL